MLAAYAGIIAYVAFAFAVVTHKIKIGDFKTSIIVLGVAFVVMIWWFIHSINAAARKQAARNARNNPQPAPRPSSSGSSGSGSHEITFRVAGTTFKNDDGTPRQDILRGLKFGDAPYADGPDDLNLEIDETTYNGELALAVSVNGYCIGFVPKSNINRVKSALDSYAWTADSVRIIGGGNDDSGARLSYGCEVTISWTD